MTLTSLIRQLEKQLKASEKFASRYEKQASGLRDKLAAVAEIAGKKVAGLISPVKTMEKRGRKKRKISAKGLANIRAGQRKRWVKQGKKGRGGAPKGRKLSAAHKRAIAEGQKKRWARQRGQA